MDLLFHIRPVLQTFFKVAIEELSGKYRLEALDDEEQKQLAVFYKDLSRVGLFSLATSGLLFIGTNIVLAFGAANLESAVVAVGSFWVTSIIAGMATAVLGLSADVATTYLGIKSGKAFELNRKDKENPSFLELVGNIGSRTKSVVKDVAIFPPFGIFCGVRSLMAADRNIHTISQSSKNRPA